MPGHVALIAGYRRRVAMGESDALATALRHVPEWGHSEFTVCTADRPGLFSTLAGVLAAVSCNVVSARITTSTDGIVLDVFRVTRGSGHDVVDDDRWSRVRSMLESVLRGDIDIETLVVRSQAARPPGRGAAGPEAMTTVGVDNEVSRDHTVLDVYTGDRVGVLFTITRTLFHLGVLIHVAKITTMLAQVLDVFYVTDARGRKIESAPLLESIQRSVSERLIGSAGTGPEASRG